MIVLVIALLVFGPKRLPELARQVGRGIREFKTHVSTVTDDVSASVNRDSDRDGGASRAATATDAPPVVADSSDDDLLDGIVVSGATGPSPPTES